MNGMPSFYNCFLVMQDALHADGLIQKPTPESLQAQKQMLEQLATIHERAEQLLLQNEQAAEREQLPHGDMVVDVTGMGRLKALGMAGVSALRESVLRAGLEQTIIWGRLKELGWDSMEVHQTALTGIRSSVEVQPLLLCAQEMFGVVDCYMVF